MPASSNEQFLDALVRHQIFLFRYSGAVRNETYRILNATEEAIADKIRSRLATTQGGPTAKNLATVGVLLLAVFRLRDAAWDKVDELWTTELLALAHREPEFTAGALRTVVPVQLPDLVTLTKAQAKELVGRLPIQGKTLSEWQRDVRANDLARIRSQITIGIVQDEAAPTIARRVVGSARTHGADGTTETTRRHVEGILATVIIAISSQTRSQFFEDNSPLFTEELYVATLDSRTTPICRSLDGKHFPVGEGPHPPLHWHCRSLRVAVINGLPLGERPMRTFTERQLLREYAERAGFVAPTTRAGLPYGSKGAFDRFARKRMRELTGRVPGRTSYKEFFSRQSAMFQDDVLGPTRGKLYRQGKLTLDKFVDARGNEIPLRDLVRLEREAFVAAGLNPENFL